MWGNDLIVKNIGLWGNKDTNVIEHKETDLYWHLWE